MRIEAVLADLAERHGLSTRELAVVAAALKIADQGDVSSQTTVDPLATSSASILLGEAVRASPAPDGQRYVDLGLIGMGGMGEVRRVRDERLGRVVARKQLRQELRSHAAVVGRFREEAQIGAQLQHPGIPPVYDTGEDGPVAWFTMEEVRGRTLGAAIDEVHGAASDGQWRTAPSGLTFGRLIDAFAKVCDAVGYAHARGVVHRDLKPNNVMLGDHGEVLVIDWGLARPIRGERRADPHDAVMTWRSADSSQHTRAGAVAGTPAYMAPEQARGEVDRLDARTDVYALGATLFQILSGHPPSEPMGRELPIPDELLRICEQAMSREPESRPADGSALAASVRAWMEGAHRRERALEMVGLADALGPTIAEHRARAAALRAESVRLLDGVATHAPEAAKIAGWAAEDEAARLDADARMLGVRVETLLHGALAHDPELREAHVALAIRHREAHASAERAGDAPRAAEAAQRLLTHVERLPESHPERIRATDYLRGDGRIELCTEPAAEADLYRYVVRDRRLVPVFERRLTTLAGPLPIGSYLLRIRPEGVAVDYPVQIGRGETWEGGTIRLPEQIRDDECAVPAGWFRSGGDPGATGGLPARRLWCDGFAIRRFPASNREWLAFLHDLVDRGRGDEALRHAPRERGSDDGRLGALLYGRSGDRFTLDGPRPFRMDDPVVMIDFPAARAYAAWEAERTGLPWRLPGELEWEKAARGVDGRTYPWGEFLDPSWCALWDSHPGPPGICPNDSFPVDCSPYGVRGLAGNVRDWCEDVWLPEGPPTDGVRVLPAADGPPDAYRTRRGGSWGDMAGRARTADRDWYAPAYRYDYLGVRLVRSLEL